MDIQFTDVKWKNIFHRFLNHVGVVSSVLRFLYYRGLVNEELRDLLALPPVGGCSHKKGMGPYVDENVEFGNKLNPITGRTKPITTDYNIYLHTFADGRRRIRCNRCGEVAWEGDKNWPKMYALLKQTTNHESAAESGPFDITTEEGRIQAAKVVANGRALVPVEPIVVYVDPVDFNKESK